MRVEIQKSLISGKIRAIPSKSYAHRIAICNFLAGNDPTGGAGDFTSKDITATEECLRNAKKGKTALDCGESGSTLRFLLSIFAAIGGSYSFIGHGKLLERPNDELFSVLSSHGVSVKKTDVIEINGKLTPGEFVIRGDISSQYISGLLMALPTLKGDSKIVLSTPLASASYVEITLEVLASFGVQIERTEYGFFVKGNQKYSGNVLPEGDWSNAAFFLVLGATAGEVVLTGLNSSSVQGDRKILEILRLSGADIEQTREGLRVRKSRLKCFSFDADDCPDLVPITAVLAANANGISTIKNVERLKIKESDRIESTIALLSSFGIKAEFSGKDLSIVGGNIKSGVADSYNDHRIAMSAAVLATVAEGVSAITTAESVEKSYPTFYEHLAKVGGKINV